MSIMLVDSEKSREFFEEKRQELHGFHVHDQARAVEVIYDIEIAPASPLRLAGLSADRASRRTWKGVI